METTNHECYVSLEVAKLLKDAGFDWKTKCRWDYCKPIDEWSLSNYPEEPINWNSKYSNYDCSAPTIEVVQRWLREVKNTAVYVCPSYEPVRFVAPNVVEDDEEWLMKWQVSAMHYDIEADEIDLGNVEGEIFDTYEEALEAGIKKILELILDKAE